MVPDGLNSRALAFAVAAGLPPQMAYTVSQTAKYTGLNKQTLYREPRRWSPGLRYAKRKYERIPHQGGRV